MNISINDESPLKNTQSFKPNNDIKKSLAKNKVSRSPVKIPEPIEEEEYSR